MTAITGICYLLPCDTLWRMAGAGGMVASLVGDGSSPATHAAHTLVMLPRPFLETQFDIISYYIYNLLHLLIVETTVISSYITYIHTSIPINTNAQKKIFDNKNIFADNKNQERSLFFPNHTDKTLVKYINPKPETKILSLKPLHC